MSLIRKNPSAKDLSARISELEAINSKIYNELQSYKNSLDNTNLRTEINDVLRLLSAGFFTYTFNENKVQCSEPLLEILENCLSGAEFSSQFLTENVHAEEKAFIIELFTAPKTFKKKITGQFRLISKGKETKEPRFFSAIGSYCKLENEQIVLTCALRDITKEVKHLRELQRAKEKAEDSDSLKTIFLYNISHNIRTPMNSILGFAELLNLSDPGPERRKEFISVIKRQSKNLLQLIDDVADIAKYESGSMNITKTPCNLNFLLNDTLKDIQQLRSEARKNQLVIECAFPSSEGVEVYTDAGRLHQIFFNLLSYVLKLSAQGHIEFGYSLPVENKIDLYVNASGFEISKEDQKNLFDRYSQIDLNSFSTYDDETGLRLSISKGIVKLLGGRIWVESEPGQGTRLNFSIPYNAVPTGHSETIVELETVIPQYKWNDKVILIVEDEEVNGLFLEAVFQEAEAQTLYAKNGLQAVELCKSISKIDLILMDIRMPVMNGIKATQEIRKFNQAIPIIAQTALALQEDMENCLKAGCNDAITKPIDVEELLKMTSKYFSQ